ncbi:hypothetical protein [uncultured Xylophilus sp.]|uniref:hypothetical protein n=1 Tax=uncultured Xylophilus sp. TaxID=296832 RepID=UPI0025F2E8C6|nr:hypothetical protein [uncultured Xylophilus sp.]
MTDRDSRAESGATRITRVIDFRLPLAWVLSSLGGLAMLIAVMYFQGNRVQEEVRELKIEVKTWNNQASTITAEQALLRFRMETAESDIRALKGLPPSTTSDRNRR